jgi:hypothetical protein
MKRKHVRRRASSDAASIGASLMLAPLVIAMRLPLMAAEARAGAELGEETMRAVSEKASAAAEGMVAAQMSLFGSAMRFWPEVFSGRTPSLFNGAAAERAVNAALKPSGRRVRANYRRLSPK